MSCEPGSAEYTHSMLLSALLISLCLDSANAQSAHLMGQGLEDSKTGARLYLKCVDPETNLDSTACPKVRWYVQVPNHGEFPLGRGHTVKAGETDERWALLSLLNPPERIQGYQDLEKDEFANGVIRQFIDGIARDAMMNFQTADKKHGVEYRSRFFGLYRSSNRQFFGGADISSIHYSKSGAKRKFLRSVFRKKGWNWSEQVRTVSHIKFTSVLRGVAKRALDEENSFRKYQVSGYSLGAYLSQVDRSFYNGQLPSGKIIKDILAWTDAY